MQNQLFLLQMTRKMWAYFSPACIFPKCFPISIPQCLFAGSKLHFHALWWESKKKWGGKWSNKSITSLQVLHKRTDWVTENCWGPSVHTWTGAEWHRPALLSGFKDKSLYCLPILGDLSSRFPTSCWVHRTKSQDTKYYPFEVGPDDTTVNQLDDEETSSETNS